MHKSQEIVWNNKQEFRIRITVEPTYELFANILNYVDNVVVIPHDDIREKIVDRLNKTIKNYLNGI